MVSAEMLLHYLYPEMDGKWKAEYLGTFYRNYNSDLIAYDAESGEVQVARDGFTKLLPSGMLIGQDALKGKGKRSKIDQQEARLQLLRELFQPIDNISFKRRMGMEREVADLLDGALDYVLTTFFHYDLQSEENEYVRQMATLLPLVRHIKGDFQTIGRLLAALFDCEVTFSIGRYSDTSHTLSWLSQVKYELLMEGLDPTGYELASRDVEALRCFLQEWFFPFDTECIISVKWHHQGMNDTKHWMLDYNTEL